MANPFASRSAKVADAIGRAFGETFTFLPFTSSGDVDLPTLPDLSRSQFNATGTWEGPTKSSTPHARGAIQDDNAHNWNASMPSVFVADAALLWRPKRGDRVLRQSDNTVFEISRPAPDGYGSTLFFLTDKKLPIPPVTQSQRAMKFNVAMNSAYEALI
jgi:hypothetical protein